MSIHVGDISKPEYFEKEVENGYQSTFWAGPIGHVQLLRRCPKALSDIDKNLATTRLSSNYEAAERSFYVQSRSF